MRRIALLYVHRATRQKVQGSFDFKPHILEYKQMYYSFGYDLTIQKRATYEVLNVENEMKVDRNRLVVDPKNWVRDLV